MSKPYVHAISSAKRYGGIPEDYCILHSQMDSSKSAFPDNRHRCVTHTIFGTFLMEKMFGMNLGSLDQLAKKHGLSPQAVYDIIVWKNECTYSGTQQINSDGKPYSVRQVSEDHILEDNGGKFIPALSDYLEHMDFAPWMNNGQGSPPSHARIAKKEKFLVID